MPPPDGATRRLASVLSGIPDAGGSGASRVVFASAPGPAAYGAALRVAAHRAISLSARCAALLFSWRSAVGRQNAFAVRCAERDGAAANYSTAADVSRVLATASPKALVSSRAPS